MKSTVLTVLSAIMCGWLAPVHSHGGDAAALPVPLTNGSTRASLTWSHTQFETFSNNEIETAQIGQEGLESLETDTRTRLAISHGLGPVTLSISQVWVRQDDIKEGETDAGVPEAGQEGHSSGRGDTTLAMAWRVTQTDTHDFAVQFGVKLPTGENDRKNRGGHRLELAHQPGSGSTDILYGLSLTPRDHHGLSASLLHVQTGNGSQNSRLGSLYQASVSWDQHLADGLDGLLGLSYVQRNRDNIRGEINPHSGGQVLTVIPGLSYRVTDAMTLSLESPVEVWDDPRGRQIEPKWSVDAGLTWDF